MSTNEGQPIQLTEITVFGPKLKNNDGRIDDVLFMTRRSSKTHITIRFLRPSRKGELKCTPRNGSDMQLATTLNPFGRAGAAQFCGKKIDLIVDAVGYHNANMQTCYQQLASLREYMAGDFRFFPR